MRTAFSFLFLIFTLSAEANDNPGVSMGITPLNDDVRTAGTMTCKSPNYRGKTGPCKTCAAKVEEWRTKFPDLTKKFTDQDNAFSLLGKKATGGTVAGVDNELAAFRAQQANAKAGAKTQVDRAKNATEAKNEFDKCQEEINKACGGGKQIMLANSDKSVAEAVQKACEDASKKSGDFADQKKKDGGGMGDLSKLMDMASKAMQMAQQQGDKDSPQQPAAETPPAAATPATATAGAIENNKLDGSGASQTPQIAFLTPKPTGDSNSSGSGLSGALSSDDRKPAHEGGGAPLPGGGTALPSAGAGGGGGGSGGGSGSGGGGASTAGAPVPNAPTEAGSEINASGGLKSGGGGKSKEGGLDPIDPNSLAPLGDTAKTEEAPPPAEGEVAAPDVLASDSESIFLRVRSKYSFLKGSGRI